MPLDIHLITPVFYENEKILSLSLLLLLLLFVFLVTGGDHRRYNSVSYVFFDKMVKKYVVLDHTRVVTEKNKNFSGRGYKIMKKEKRISLSPYINKPNKNLYIY